MKLDELETLAANDGVRHIRPAFAAVTGRADSPRAGAKHRTGEASVMPVQLRVRGSTAQRRRKRVSPALGTTMVSGSAS